LESCKTKEVCLIITALVVLATGYLILLEVAAICHYKDCDKEKDKEKEMREMKWKDNQGHTFELDDKEVEIIAQRAVFLDNPDGTSEVKNFSPVVELLHF